MKIEKTKKYRKKLKTKVKKRKEKVKNIKLGKTKK